MTTPSEDRGATPTTGPRPGTEPGGPTRGRRRLVVVLAGLALVALSATALFAVRAGDDVVEADRTPPNGDDGAPCSGPMCGPEAGAEPDGGCEGEMCGAIVPDEPPPSDGPVGEPGGEVDPGAEACPPSDPMCGPLGPDVLGRELAPPS